MSRSSTVFTAPRPNHPAQPPSARTRHSRLLITGLATLLVALFAPASPASAETQWRIDGGGYGHGVGMSQYGACSLAASGSSAAQILAHYYRGTALATVAEHTDLRVLLRKSSSFTLVTGGTTSFNGVVRGSGQTVYVNRSGSSIVMSGAVTGSAGSKLTVAMSGSPLTVSPPGNRFNRGQLEITLDSGGGLQAIVVGLSSNDFLRGLGEMPSSWPAEALKAQAIAARTVAHVKRAGRGSNPYDLNAALDGYYIGYDKEFGAQGSNWVSAVNATNGRVVTHNGSMISALYSSSSGGHTENSEVVWVSALPYLRSVSDPADAGCNNSNHTWSKTLGATEMGQKLGMTAITAVSIGPGASATGRLDKVNVTFTDSRGFSASYTGAQLRWKLGLKSTKFTIRGATGGGGSGPPGGSLIDIRLHDGRNLLVAGTAGDPDGAPRVLVATKNGSRVDMWVTQSVNGYYLDVHPVAPGKHTTCVAALDVPTGSAVLLGCRENVVK